LAARWRPLELILELTDALVGVEADRGVVLLGVIARMLEAFLRQAQSGGVLHDVLPRAGQELIGPRRLRDRIYGVVVAGGAFGLAQQSVVALRCVGAGRIRILFAGIWPL